MVNNIANININQQNSEQKSMLKMQQKRKNLEMMPQF